MNYKTRHQDFVEHAYDSHLRLQVVWPYQIQFMQLLSFILFSSHFFFIIFFFLFPGVEHILSSILFKLIPLMTQWIKVQTQCPSCFFLKNSSHIWFAKDKKTSPGSCKIHDLLLIFKIFFLSVSLSLLFLNLNYR